MGLEGKKVILREERESDLPFLIDLRNDLETQGWSQRLPPDYTLDMYTKRHTERDFTMKRNEGRFVIVDKENKNFIGTIGYTDLSARMSGTIGIAIAKKFWRTGVAADAVNVLVAFMFHELGLQVVRLWTHSGNIGAVKSAEKAGFKVGVRMRESIFMQGEIYDNLVMDMIREEFYALNPDLKDNYPAVVYGSKDK